MFKHKCEIRRKKNEIGRRPRELEKLDHTTSEWMGDLESDSPNENVYLLPTLGRSAAASVREACREGVSSSSATTNTTGPIKRT